MKCRLVLWYKFFQHSVQPVSAPLHCWHQGNGNDAYARPFICRRHTRIIVIEFKWVIHVSSASCITCAIQCTCEICSFIRLFVCNTNSIRVTIYIALCYIPNRNPINIQFCVWARILCLWWWWWWGRGACTGTHLVLISLQSAIWCAILNCYAKSNRTEPT